MPAFPIEHIAARGAAPDAAPYELDQTFAHTAENMRYFANSLTATCPNVQLSFTWGAGGSATGAGVVTATVFNGNIWVLRRANEGEEASVYVIEPNGAAMVANFIADVGPTLRRERFLTVNSSLLFVADNKNEMLVLAFKQADGTEARPATPLSNVDTYAADWNRAMLSVYKNQFVALTPQKLGADLEAPRSNTVIFSDLIPFKLEATGPTWVVAGDNIATEFVLDNQGEQLITSSRLGDRLIVFSEAESWAVDFLGQRDAAGNVHSNTGLFQGDGALSAHSAAEVAEGMQAVMGNANFYLHNGASQQYPANGRIRRFILDQPQGLQWAQVTWNATNQEVLIVPTSAQDNKVFIYNLQHDAWSWVTLESFAPGATNINRLNRVALQNLDPTHWEKYSPLLKPLENYRGNAVLVCADNGLFVDTYSTTTPFLDNRTTPFELFMPYMDLNHISQQPNAHRHQWLNALLPQVRASMSVKWDVRLYNEYPRTELGRTELLDANLVYNVQREQDFSTFQHMFVDAAGRYISLRLWNDVTKPGMFSLDGITAEITPNAYAY